jgi:hypothetical protein
MKNHSGRAIHGNPNPPYDVHDGDGDPPNGFILVAAAGGNVPADYVARYGLEGKLGPPDGQDAPTLTNWDGEPLVTLDSGRAVAASVAPAHMRPKAEGEAGTQAGTESKAVNPGDTENKGAAGPGPATRGGVTFGGTAGKPTGSYGATGATGPTGPNAATTAERPAANVVEQPAGHVIEATVGHTVEKPAATTADKGKGNR